MSAKSRLPEIRRRQTRKVKIDKLRRRYSAARTDEDRQKVFVKARVLSPLLTLEQFTKVTAAKA